MGALISFRDGLAKIYRNFDFLFKFILKFVFAFWCLSYLTNSLGYYDLLNVGSIRLFIAVICAFLPPAFIVLVIALVALLHLFKLSLVFGVVSAILFLIIYLLYLRFASAQGVFMLAIACLAPLNLHFAVAFFLGLFFTPVTIIPAALTVIVVEFVKCVKTVAVSVGPEMEIEKILAGYQSVIDSMLSNKQMLVTIVVLAVIIVLAFVIKQLPFDYSWYVSIAVAAIVGIVVLFVGNTIMGAGPDPVKSIVGIVIGAALGLVIQFLSCIVDYPKKQYVQFEDDDYYYYVKAIPKIGGKNLDDDSYDGDDDYEDMSDHRNDQYDAYEPVDSSEALFTELASRKAQQNVTSDEVDYSRIYSEQPMDPVGIESPAEPGQTQVFDDGAFDNYDFYSDNDTNLF